MHVVKGGSNGKIWLLPDIEIAYIHRFKNSEIKMIMEIVDTHSHTIKSKWNEYFSK